MIIGALLIGVLGMPVGTMGSLVYEARRGQRIDGNTVLAWAAANFITLTLLWILVGLLWH